jgi:hypothetical protein
MATIVCAQLLLTAILSGGLVDIITTVEYLTKQYNSACSSLLMPLHFAIVIAWSVTSDFNTGIFYLEI